jgi:hypothetical protein
MTKNLPDVELVAACDVFEPRYLEAAQIMGPQPVTNDLSEGDKLIAGVEQS